MVLLCYVIIFSSLLLPYASPASFSRRHLTQTSTPNGSPFFPPYTSSSPPLPQPTPLPPPTTTFQTFPANISALVLPRSPKPHTPSKTLLIPAISAVLAVATAVGLAMFLYGRWRGQNRHFKDSPKTSDSPQRNNTENKLTVAPSPSNILYLGNVVTSGSVFVKPESPEIRPLPPLPVHSFLQLIANTNEEDQNENEEEEEEEGSFYSPLTSIAGQQKRTNPYSNCSCSLSSTSVSPAMSPSVTISNPPHLSPERHVRNNNKRYVPSLRMFTLGFPRISSSSTSPERGMIRTPDAYARSSIYSSVSTTPDRFFLRKVLETSPPRWNDFSRNVKSLFLSPTSVSPARDLSEVEEHRESVSPPKRPPPELPPIVPPSQSFMVQKPGKKLSFSELPWEVKTERVKTKLNPLPWEKVRPSSCRKNTWESLKFNSLNSNPKQRSLSCDLPKLNQEIRVLGSRESQNLDVLLTTLKITTNDVVHALRHGHYQALGVELLECLSRIAPSKTEEEELLKSFSDVDDSVRFLKELLKVPFVFKRVNALLFIAKFNSNVEYLIRSFDVIKAACDELDNSRTLMNLLEAVLEKGTKIGNIRDYKLETVLKLVDIKPVIENIIESEGTKGLQVVRSLSSVLVNVKKASEMDYGVLTSDVSKFYQQGVKKVSEVVVLCEENGENEEFRESMRQFLKNAEEEVKRIEMREVSLVDGVKEITECFHGGLVNEELLRVFVIIRDFLSIVDKVCMEMDVT